MTVYSTAYTDRTFCDFTLLWNTNYNTNNVDIIVVFTKVGSAWFHHILHSNSILMITHEILEIQTKCKDNFWSILQGLGSPIYRNVKILAGKKLQPRGNICVVENCAIHNSWPEVRSTRCKGEIYFILMGLDSPITIFIIFWILHRI
jgi:hypothetical protein